MMLSHLYWHLLHSSLSGGINSKVLYTGKKKREMTVEVGSFSGRPGCYLGNIEFFPAIEMIQFSSFLLGMLLASSVGR